jgi:hypothetical protein
VITEIITENWKSDIGKTFTEKKIYRLEYLNKQLNDDMNEWAAHIRKYDDVSADTVMQSCEYGMCNPAVQLTIKIRSKMTEYPPFIVIFGYCPNDTISEIVLKIKFTQHIKFRNILENNFRFDDRENHVFSDEELSGVEIFECGFIFWKLNDLLKKWLNNVDKSA